MGKLFIFMGKSASGKDTLFARIRERHPELRTVVPYTTRPVRSEEKEGQEYHFVTEERLRELESENKVVECRCYQTIHGPWYYFTVDDGQIDFDKGSYGMITTLEGYAKIREFYGKESIVPIYIEVDDFVRMTRSLEREKGQRKPCVAEVCRRFLADEKDFSEEKLKNNGICNAVVNNDLTEAVFQIEGILQAGSR